MYSLNHKRIILYGVLTAVTIIFLCMHASYKLSIYANSNKVEMEPGGLDGVLDLMRTNIRNNIGEQKPSSMDVEECDTPKIDKNGYIMYLPHSM